MDYRLVMTSAGAWTICITVIMAIYSGKVL